MARIGIITFNQYERGAIEQLLGDEGFISGRVMDGIFSTKICVWKTSMDDVVLVNTGLSGNLVASLNVSLYLIDPLLPPCLAWVLFGCAGAIPSTNPNNTQYVPAKGEVVIVTEAVYVENGLVSDDKGTETEYVRLKNDRFHECTYPVRRGYSQSFANFMGLPQVKAVSVDKVVRLDKTTLANANSPAPLVDYASALKATEAQILDMESFGFLKTLEDRYSARAVTIRVITDELYNHSETKQGRVDDGRVHLSPEQSRLLDVGAAKFKDFYTFLKSRFEYDGNIPREELPVRLSLASRQLVREGINRLLEFAPSQRIHSSFDLRDFAANLIPEVIGETEGILGRGAEVLNLETRYFLSGLVSFFERGYGSVTAARMLRSASPIRIEERTFNGIQLNRLYANELGEMVRTYFELIAEINPLLRPSTSVKKSIEFYFGKEVLDYVLKVRMLPNTRFVQIGKRGSSWDQEAPNILITVGADFRRNATEFRMLTPFDQAQLVRWDGFDSDAILVSSIENTFDLQSVRRIGRRQ